MVVPMAECAASASFIKLHLRGAGIGERGSLNHKLYFRKLSHLNAEAVSFINCKVHELCATRKSNRHHTTSFTCPCLGSLVSVNATTASEWIPVADQVLLLASMLLTHIAGVTTVKNPSDTSTKTNISVGMISGGSTFSGSATSNDGDPVLVWNVMKQKLFDSLEVANEITASGDGVPEFAKGPLSLSALAEGPRLRLLLAVVINLEKEVGAIPESLEAVDDWKIVFFSTIKKSLKPICMDWLEKEFLKENSVSNEVLISFIMNKLKGDDSILQNIRKSGKEDLYADLFCYLGHGSLRGGFYYDNSLFVSQGTSVLEDLVIALADGIASIYLELISVDGNVSNEMNTLASTLCSLSTRSLQRLRNEVALKQWLHQNMEAVASMYEDRFDLRVLQVQTRTVEEPSKCPLEGIRWWEQIFAKKSRTASTSLQYVVIGSFSMAVKRTKELRALSGWRYYFSLFLELSDITMPLIRTIIDKVSNAISFFLVCLIGRSLGLIYTGIRQSLRWNLGESSDELK